jgi:selenophosphate synthase
LDSILSRLPRPTDPNVLVGFETSDDAAVYRLNAETALVQTVDILTPVADDPFTYGRIAAANSLSDVYAMGGRPISAPAEYDWPRFTREMSDAKALAAVQCGIPRRKPHCPLLVLSCFKSSRSDSTLLG